MFLKIAKKQPKNCEKNAKKLITNQLKIINVYN